jgi:hypothetical protein
VSPLSAIVVIVLGAVCAAGTVWWALRAERAFDPSQAPAASAALPAPEPAWWETAEWWPALSDEERQWVLRNLADAGHPAAGAALRRTATSD